MSPSRYRSLIVCFLAVLSCTISQADELRCTQQDQRSVAVTIYNENLALVKDQRKIQFASGQNLLAFRRCQCADASRDSFAAQLDQPGKSFSIEQNFDFDLLTPQKLLDKYVGKSVSIIRTNPATGAETTEQAQVLAASNGVVMRIGDRIETGIPGRIVYPDVPANLRDRPTLVMSLNNSGAAQQDVELSYLTGGLAWKADYVAELSAADDRLDLSGWVTLTNTSGASYNNARLQLVAGDVNQVRSNIRFEGGMADKMAMAAPASRMAEESLMEYHLYRLDRPTTIAENQTKQVSLLTAAAVPARKELLLRGAGYYYGSSYGELGQKMKVSVFVEFDNKEASHLGMPLPKGVIRVYKKDGAGNAQFVGEDSIDHTPKNEKVRLKLGESFDVTADKKQTDFKRLPSPERGTALNEGAFEIVLKNARKEAVTVVVQEPIPGDWKVLKESHAHEKAASNTAVWRIAVPAEGSATLDYRVQVSY